MTTMRVFIKRLVPFYFLSCSSLVPATDTEILKLMWIGEQFWVYHLLFSPLFSHSLRLCISFFSSGHSFSRSSHSRSSFSCFTWLTASEQFSCLCSVVSSASTLFWYILCRNCSSFCRVLSRITSCFDIESRFSFVIPVLFAIVLLHFLILFRWRQS